MGAKHPVFSTQRENTTIQITVQALDGSNPTRVKHNMANCRAAFPALVGSAAPGDGTSFLTYVINGDYVDVYAWKNESGTDPTLAASTGTETFSCICAGE